jgi:hypothetical protein
MNSNPSSPIYTREDFPDVEKDDNFKSFINDPRIKTIGVFLILNEIRKYDVESMAGETAKVQLAKLQAYQTFMDLPTALQIKHEAIEEE